MPTPLLVPELGAGQLPIRVSTWLVDLGDDVLAGDRVVELGLPGMTFDVSSPASGRLVRIEKYSDAAVHTGDCLGWLEQPEPNSTPKESA
ncbi:MAG: biotin/lipoyl-containing protein [Planctomycetales bacterium]